MRIAEKGIAEKGIAEKGIAGNGGSGGAGTWRARLARLAAANMAMGVAVAAVVAIVAGTAAEASDLQDICDDCQFERVASCGEFLEGINFDAGGGIWAVSLFSGDILEVRDGACTVRGKTGGHPNGARFHRDGRLFIADNSGGILTFDPRTGKLAVFADHVGATPIRNANDLVFDRAGGLYVTIPGDSNYLDRSGRVVYFPPDSAPPVVLAERLPFPNGIVLSLDEKFVTIGLYDTKEIITIPSVSNRESKRGPYTFVRSEGGVGPDGMAMDSDGRLYWANFLAGAIGVADSRGFVVGYLHLPPSAGLQTTNLAFHGGYLYVTEAGQGEIWRVKVKTTGQPLAYP